MRAGIELSQQYGTDLTQADVNNKITRVIDRTSNEHN